MSKVLSFKLRINKVQTSQITSRSTVSCPRFFQRGFTFICSTSKYIYIYIIMIMKSIASLSKRNFQEIYIRGISFKVVDFRFSLKKKIWLPRNCNIGIFYAWSNSNQKNEWKLSKQSVHYNFIRGWIAVFNPSNNIIVKGQCGTAQILPIIYKFFVFFFFKEPIRMNHLYKLITMLVPQKLPEIMFDAHDIGIFYAWSKTNQKNEWKIRSRPVKKYTKLLTLSYVLFINFLLLG